MKPRIPRPDRDLGIGRVDDISWQPCCSACVDGARSPSLSACSTDEVIVGRIFLVSAHNLPLGDNRKSLIIPGLEEFLGSATLSRRGEQRQASISRLIVTCRYLAIGWLGCCSGSLRFSTTTLVALQLPQTNLASLFQPNTSLAASAIGHAPHLEHFGRNGSSRVSMRSPRLTAPVLTQIKRNFRRSGSSSKERRPCAIVAGKTGDSSRRSIQWLKSKST